MWVCRQCYQENHDQDDVCRSCGAQKSAGRFQAQTHARRAAPRASQVPPPEPVIAVAQPVSEPASVKPRAQSYAPPPFDLPKKKRSPLEKFASCIGSLLALLLPLLTAALAWRQHTALRAALLPLLLDESAADGVQWVVYIALSLVAALLSALPGLWTLIAARRLSPRAIRH